VWCRGRSNGPDGYLIGAQGAAAACVLGPAKDAGLEEGAINDQLPAPLEQIEQARVALRPLELVCRLDGHPRHSAAIASREWVNAFSFTKLVARDVSFLRRHDQGCVMR
jgi:hypothetical protein